MILLEIHSFSSSTYNNSIYPIEDGTFLCSYILINNDSKRVYLIEYWSNMFTRMNQYLNIFEIKDNGFKNMKTILLDVDDVICTNHFIPVINMYLNSTYTESDFDSIKFEMELFPNDKDRNKFYDFFVTVDSYKYSQLKPNAYDIIKQLVKNNRIIFIQPKQIWVVFFKFIL